MRLQSLLALAAASALLLPLSATAATLPADYQMSCMTQAQKHGLTKDKAEGYCSCAGKVLEKNLTEAQIKDLNTLEDGVDAAVMKSAQEKVAAACAPKK